MSNINKKLDKQKAEEFKVYMLSEQQDIKLHVNNRTRRMV